MEESREDYIRHLRDLIAHTEEHGSDEDMRVAVVLRVKLAAMEGQCCA